MAEIDKVIKGLEHCQLMTSNITFNPCYECPYKGEYSCAEILKTDALELLKKQTPIEPEYFMDGLVKRCRCKKCGKHIVSVGRYLDNYCAKCGQAVKWE